MEDQLRNVTLITGDWSLHSGFIISTWIAFLMMSQIRLPPTSIPTHAL